jgi:hypothetical protein
MIRIPSYTECEYMNGMEDVNFISYNYIVTISHSFNYTIKLLPYVLVIVVHCFEFVPFQSKKSNVAFSTPN